MKYGIISDTHDHLPTLGRALELMLEHKVDYLIHCGDWTKENTLRILSVFALSNNFPLVGVFGNRDDREQLDTTLKSLKGIFVPKDYELLHLKADNISITVYHGHHKPTLKRLIDEAQYDVLFTGHTHRPLIQSNPGALIVNPGSTAYSIPRRNEPRSFAIYDSKQHQAKIIYFE